MLKDPALEARARHISQELRCLVCQNQSIDDSNAELARDLRLLVRERLTAGDTDAAVLAFVEARYGEFVLLRPRLRPHTLLLWLTPSSSSPAPPPPSPASPDGACRRQAPPPPRPALTRRAAAPRRPPEADTRLISRLSAIAVSRARFDRDAGITTSRRGLPLGSFTRSAGYAPAQPLQQRQRGEPGHG